VIRRAVDDAGIAVGVINSGRLRPAGYALLHRDAEIRRKSVDVFKRFIDLGGALGARVGLGMARGDADTTIPAPDLEPVMLDVFGEIAAHAASRGTRVMLEPADPGYVAAILRVAEAREMARRIASPGFGIMLDTYQLDQVEESYEEGFGAAAGMADHIHLYDRHHWSPGIEPSEQMDWPRIRAAMVAHGFAGSGSTVPPKAGDMVAGTRASTAFIRASLMSAPPASRPARQALVTGGGSGIGEAASRAFAAGGYAVVVADVSEDRAAAVAAAITDSGGSATALRLDVGDAAGVSAAIAGIDGAIDALVCAAGVFAPGTAETTSVEEWRRVIDINLTGSFLCVKAALPKMRRGGSIVLLSSSTGAHDALANSVAYCSSKGGVTLLAKALAADLAPEGIRVNAIAPGPTDTPMLRGILDEEGLRAFAATLPAQRLGTAAEIAAVAVFLAGDAASFVTGAVVPVDGGQTAVV